MYMIIYRATNILNNKSYIGQTIYTLEYRRKQHERSIRYKHTKNNVFARALAKYGAENFVWEIIDTASTNIELNKKEAYWIESLNTLAEGGWGYNIKKGGDNHKHSERTKKLISEAQKGELGPGYGKCGKLNPKSKTVLNLTTGEIYDSANLCAIAEGLNFSHVCAVFRGARGSTGGYVFRYIDEDFNIIEPQYIAKVKAKPVINLDTLEEFNSCAEAVKSVNRKSGANLSNALLRGNGKCIFAGYNWAYK